MATPAILLREWLDGSLSFLVSLVFHLFLLLFLALWVIPPQPTAPITVRMAPHEQDVVLADLELDSPTPLETDVSGDIPLEVAPEVFPAVADPEILEIELVDVDRPPTRSPSWLVEEDIDWFRQVTQAAGAASAGDADIVRDRPPADLRRRLQREGARGGEVQVSLAWNNVNDLDLHVICPSGEEISYRNMRSRCQGRLDVDMNVRGNRPWSERPVENIFWPDAHSPSGDYIVVVNHYSNNGARDPTRYWVTVSIRGRSDQTFSGSIRSGQERQVVCRFYLP